MKISPTEFLKNKGIVKEGHTDLVINFTDSKVFLSELLDEFLKLNNSKNERHLKETIQRQADKIKELEANLQDYSVKWDLKNKQLNAQLDEAFDETKKLNKILYYFDTKLKNNAEYQQLKSDLIGGKEEQINFEV
jgi:hypothetical protein